MVKPRPMTGVRIGRDDMRRGWTFDLGIPEIVAGYSNPSDLEQYRQLRFGVSQRRGWLLWWT